MRHGGKILVDQLASHGVKRVFTVPGESFLAVLDGLYDCPSIKAIVCRHEGGAAMMAEATGKLTGRPGICFATRGPGAANAMAGVYIAERDATPMILFVGLPAVRLDERSPFQDMELEALFAPLSKWATVIRDTARIPEYIARAFLVAASDRPGPVVIGLPENVLSASADVSDVQPAHIPAAAPSERTMRDIAHRLDTAERPMLLVGGPGWSIEVKGAVEAFALKFDLPIASAFRCQDYIDNRHPCYVGHLGFGTDKKLRAGLENADVILAIGAELGEITTGGYSLIEAPNPSQFLIHVHPTPAWSGGVFNAALPIAASAAGFAEALEVLMRDNVPDVASWAPFRHDLRAAYKATLAPKGVPGAVDLGKVVRTISDLLPDDGMTTNGAGNYSQFVHRYFEFKTYRSGLAPICGYMGYGLPAAIAAKLEEPARPVVAFAGDGCFQMTAAEVGTAVEYGLPMVIVVASNGMYGTIRMHQERQYPGRVMATTIMNPNFVALAKSFGGDGEAVTRTADFEEAFERALASEVPYLIELPLDPEAITPLDTLSNIRKTATKK
jgi:acetolactate synthase I/II/III large subunit